MAQGTPSGRTRIVAAGRTDVGRRRKHNEDTVLVRPELRLYVVADGMGGHNAGEVASALAASSFENFLLATRTGDVPAEFGGAADGLSRDARRLAGAARKANADVFEIASTRRQHAGMGSTLVAAMVSESERQVHIVHAGDSRCYRIRDGAIEQLTRDHSLINDALAMKPDLTAEMIAELPKNVITRAVGTQDTLDVDLRSEPLRPGDLYLLCSDGLSGLVDPTQMLETSELTTDLEEMGDLLVIMANEAGGIDNISVVLFRVEEVDGVVRAAAPSEAEEQTALEVGEDEAAEPDGSLKTTAVWERPSSPDRQPAADRPAHATTEVEPHPDVSLRAAHEPIPAGSPEPRESGVRVVSRPGIEAPDVGDGDVDELDADLATAEELALIEAELAAEGEPLAAELVEPPLPSTPPPRPPPRGPAVEVRPIISIGTPAPSKPRVEPVSEPPPPPDRAAGDEEVMVCTVCGAEALVGNRFCVECGTRHQPQTAAVVLRSDLPAPTDGFVDVELDEGEPKFDEYDELALDDVVEEPQASPSPPPVPGVASFCHHCGTRIADDNAFCVQCGARLL